MSPPHAVFSWQSAGDRSGGMAEATLRPDLAEELAGVVRSALAGAGGGGLGRAPSRLELRMACQEVVAAVQAHFSKLEAALPAALSFEVDGSSATDALNQRIAALRSRPSSSPARAERSQLVQAPAPRLFNVLYFICICII